MFSHDFGWAKLNKQVKPDDYYAKIIGDWEWEWVWKNEIENRKQGDQFQQDIDPAVAEKPDDKF